jgi:hypothetical protein
VVQPPERSLAFRQQAVKWKELADAAHLAQEIDFEGMTSADRRASSSGFSRPRAV